MIYASTACLPEAPLDVRLREYQRYHLDGIELGGGVTFGPGAEEHLLHLAANGKTFLVHNYFPPPALSFILNLASADPEIRNRSLTFARSALDLCARLGAPAYSVHAGFVTDAVGRDGTGFAFPAPTSQRERTRALERFEDAVGELLPYARSVGVRLLIENNVCRPAFRGRLLLESAEDCRALFGERPPDGLGLLLDTGHLNVTATTYAFDRHAFVDAVAPYIAGFHVHDNDGQDDWHEPIRPGSWVLDVLRAVRRPGVPVVVEAKFESASDLRRQVEWLSEELSR